MKKRTPPTINAGSMADIAFLMLLFFLVSTQINNPKGIQVRLPPYEPGPPVQYDEDLVLTITLNEDNLVALEGDITPLDRISDGVKNHINSKLSMGEQPIISYVTDTSAIYESYIHVYDEIKTAFSELREDYAQRSYNRSYRLLSRDKKLTVNKVIPMIISEADYH